MVQALCRCLGRPRGLDWLHFQGAEESRGVLKEMLCAYPAGHGKALDKGIIYCWEILTGLDPVVGLGQKEASSKLCVSQRRPGEACLEPRGALQLRHGTLPSLYRIHTECWGPRRSPAETLGPPDPCFCLFSSQATALSLGALSGRAEEEL